VASDAPPDAESADLMIALHARRSADAIEHWSSQRPRRPLVLVLTGTDLYRDLAIDARAQASLARADRIVVLDEQGPEDLPAALRGRCTVSVQSVSARRTVDKPRRWLRAIAVGHLREEKGVEQLFDAARLLSGRRGDILIDHLGAPLDRGLGQQAARLARDVPTYRWLDARPHADARRRIQHAHLLVHPSRMEGGAHAIIEAVRSGTPVVATRIPGNVGLLGEDYRGYVPVGDARALADMLVRCRDDPRFLQALARQCEKRAARFDPARERARLIRLVGELLAASGWPHE
jgi:putative glycosyltransferase (TIGR04348 family)